VRQRSRVGRDKSIKESSYENIERLEKGSQEITKLVRRRMKKREYVYRSKRVESS